MSTTNFKLFCKSIYKPNKRAWNKPKIKPENLKIKANYEWINDIWHINNTEITEKSK